MQNKRDEIKRIWREAFDDSAEYVDMYFDRVYDESSAMTLEVDSRTLSSLLLLRYSMTFHGSRVPVSYISGAATRRSARGKGYMSQLMRMALIESHRRGDMLCTLIPAHSWLYYFYNHFDFSTVFYVDVQRFTSLHAFAGPDGYTPVEDHYSERVYEAFARMEQAIDGRIQHTQRDFLNILDDLSFEDDGRFVAMADATGRIVSMAWGVAAPGMVTVTDLLGENQDAMTAALRQLRSYWPERPFKLLAAVDDARHRRLTQRGMARIVNVEMCLSAIARAYPDWSSAIRVTDPLIAANSHKFLCGEGSVRVDDSYEGKLSLDVDIDVFNRMVFSSRKIGEVIGLPSVRPHISLMLD